MSFTNTKVFIQLALYPQLEDRVTVTQDWDGPTYLHVGKFAKDEACNGIADRYSLEVGKLLKVRGSA